MTDFFHFLIENRTEIFSQTIEHIELTLVALVIATFFSISIGIMLSRNVRWASPVIAVVNIIQTIPSIALLGFLLPFFGIGVVPAVIALFLYALLPILRNTFTGIIEIDPAVREAARGMGMTDLQILWRVELPIALPIIFAGIRTASVINVGVATLSALIAAGGLGEFIFKGIQLNNSYMIFAGAIPASLLALFFDFFLGLVQNHTKLLLKPVLAVVAVLTIGYAIASFHEEKRGFTGGFPIEFIEREDGLKGLFEHYDIRFDYLELEIGFMYDALKNKKVDIVSGFSTDGRIKAFNFKTLKDDKNYFPPYEAAALLNGQTLREYPQLAEVLDIISGEISNEEMTLMNFKVDQEKQQPRIVALEFLKEKGFNTTRNNAGVPDIIIGSKAFTESYILAHIISIIIENYTGLSTEMKLGFGGTKLVMDALRLGEIDVYPEYTGTALLLLLDPEKATIDSLLGSKTRVFNYVKTESKHQFDLVWQAPFGFNNTFALLMRERDANQKKIEKISDLKRVLDK